MRDPGVGGPNPRELDPQELAERCCTVMWTDDRASAALGMQVDEVGPGRAVVSMVLRDDMLNGWGSGHGGLVSAVADSAFAVACNSHGEVTVAAGFDITFLAPAPAGERLVATAEERSRRGRSGVYDVTVRAGDEVVAEMRGRSRSSGRPIVADPQL